MNVRTIVMAALLSAACWSCSQNSSQSKSGNKQALNGEKPGAAAAGQATAARSEASGAKAADSSVPAIPKDARWTIYCTSVGGNNHVSEAKALRNWLVETTGRRDWYIVQGQGQTTVYYGFYRAVSDREDKQDAARAHGDVKAISAMVNPSTGGKLFQVVSLVSLESEDPAAPPEWNLLTAKGSYTLQVGVYKGSPDRKAAAVQAVREAREKGIEAYYYHGPTASSVCVGCWDEGAVNAETEARASSPNSVPVVVQGSGPLPGSQTTIDGKPVEVVRPKMEILDPALIETVRKFPYMAINGVESKLVKNPRTGQTRWAREPSLVVRIPREEAVAAPSLQIPSSITAPAEGTVQSRKPAAAGSTARPARSLPASKGGKLRSIED